MYNCVNNTSSHLQMSASPSKKTFVCAICSASFAHSSGLRRHRLKQHPGQSPVTNDTKKCGECGEKFSNMQKLCAHVKDVHNFDANIEKYTFPNKAEYEEWRKCVERKGCFQFVNRGSSSHGEGGIYLFCHRSGCYRPKGSNLRAPKSNVTNRIGYDFSAFAAVKFSAGRVEVTACLDHYGHDKCGDFETDVFMSDDAPAYFNAWSTVFPSNRTRKLLFIWHVLKNWNKNIKEKVTSKEDQAYFYMRAYLLAHERSQEQFKDDLNLLLIMAHKLQPAFYDYFNDYYCNPSRILQWALWARSDSIVNTNMYLERFHRTLKYKYLNKKRINYNFSLNIPVDSIGNVLSSFVHLPHVSHRKGMAIRAEDVLKKDEGWEVSVIPSHACKHIHAVHTFAQEQEASLVPATIPSTVNFTGMEIDMNFNFQSESDLSPLAPNSTDGHKLLRARLLKVADSLNFLSDDEVNALGMQIVDAKTKIACCNSQQEFPSQSIIPNKRRYSKHCSGFYIILTAGLRAERTDCTNRKSIQNYVDNKYIQEPRKRWCYVTTEVTYEQIFNLSAFECIRARSVSAHTAPEITNTKEKMKSESKKEESILDKLGTIGRRKPKREFSEEEEIEKVENEGKEAIDSSGLNSCD
uniref:C2H2-type domain-containing protein n=1 Tax=Romanomermis culicivorax TaxID=13658 RepID=A0A915IGY5_ROMCU